MTPKDLQKMFANPFYCLEKVDDVFQMKHKPLITEREWIKTGAIVIEEIGAEKFLQLLLDNLKGNYVK
jgi:hypothetical protein